MEKWIPRCRRGDKQSGQGRRGQPPRLPHTRAGRPDGMGLKTKFPSGSKTGNHANCISCPRGFRGTALPKGVSRAGHGVCDHSVTRESSPSPPPSDLGVLTSPIFCTRLSVVHPEYVVLSTAGSRYGGELQIRRQTRCVWPLPGTRKDMEQETTRALKRDPDPAPAEVQIPCPTGSQEEWPHFTAENTEFLTCSKLPRRQGKEADKLTS